MRPNQNKNRQRGRNGGRKHVNPLSRNFESNGPDVKVRGNAAHIAEKYLQLARDAQSSGDSVMAENYLQHAEHYFRIVSAAQQQMSGQRDGQQGDDDFDDDMPDMNSRFASPQPVQPQQFAQGEGEEAGEGEQPRQQHGDQRPPRQDGQDGERPQRGDRRDRQRNRDRFRPQGEEQPQPAAAAEQPAAPEAVEAPVSEAPVEAAEGEGRKPRERRPRRRRPAGGEGGDLAGADQPDVGELPAFLTAGSNAAE